MKIKTNELAGNPLNWAVAEGEGNVQLQYDSREGLIIRNILGWIPYRPSVAWQQGGPIIEREKITLEHLYGAGDAGADVWVATLTCEDKKFGGVECFEEQGPTPLIAAMRCYVASKLGDIVDVPEELK
jgi:hypothetical protein